MVLVMVLDKDKDKDKDKDNKHVLTCTGTKSAGISVLWSPEFSGILHTEVRRILRNSVEVKTNSEKNPTFAKFEKSTSVETSLQFRQRFLFIQILAL
jgi:hypothetical protein